VDLNLIPEQQAELDIDNLKFLYDLLVKKEKEKGDTRNC
jgi:hypothetical protein